MEGKKTGSYQEKTDAKEELQRKVQGTILEENVNTNELSKRKRST